MWSDEQSHRLRSGLILAATLMIKAAIVSTAWSRSLTGSATSLRVSYRLGETVGTLKTTLRVVPVLLGNPSGQHFRHGRSSSAPSS